jgi:hypothetical protein
MNNFTYLNPISNKFDFALAANLTIKLQKKLLLAGKNPFLPHMEDGIII